MSLKTREKQSVRHKSLTITKIYKTYLYIIKINNQVKDKTNEYKMIQK